MAMNCGCNGTYDLDACDGPADVWNEGRINATRKEHRCGECGEMIPSGTRCCYASWLYDGRWTTVRRCLKCSFVAEAISTITGTCPLWGGLMDYVGNNGFNVETMRFQ